MSLDTVGILSAIDFAAERPTVIDAVAREVLVNEAPLFSRLPRVQATDTSWTINSRDARKRSFVIGTGGVATTGATSLPIADATPFMTGDVIELNDGTNLERVQVVAAPTVTTTPNTLTIVRAQEGTTANTFAAGAVLRLIGNSRTGAEIDQQAYRAVVAGLAQYIQTVQYPVQIGGLAEAITNVVLPPGSGGSVMGLDKAAKMVDAVRDIEFSMYYGIGQKAAASGDRQKMRGLKNLIASYNSGANVSTSAKTNYTRAQFLTDSIQKIANIGGAADTILCSTDFLGFLDVWVPGKQTIMDGATTALGFPIQTYKLALGGKELRFVEAIQLLPGTAVVLSSNDLDTRFIRELQWVPRERRGDAYEGDWIGDYAINMSRPQWHAWVEGIGSAA